MAGLLRTILFFINQLFSALKMNRHKKSDFVEPERHTLAVVVLDKTIDHYCCLLFVMSLKTAHVDILSLVD